MAEYDCVIIGGGAAGLMAAAVAAERGKKILLLGKMEKVGRKIRITGKGRCNVTNNKSHEEFLSKVRAGGDFVTPAFEMFDNVSTIRLFERIGVPISIEQGGRAYPRSGDAWDIATALEKWILKHKGVIMCNCEVERLILKDNQCVGVSIQHKGNSEIIEASSVMIATGGVSYPGTGSTGDGYGMAYEVGHTIIPVAPSLVPFEIAGNFLSIITGLILKNITLSLSVNGVEKSKEMGEIEFFRFGVGGGVVFRLSRDAVGALMDGHKVDFVLDMKPSLSVPKLLGRTAREIEAKANLTFGEFLVKLLPAKMASVVCQSSKIGRDKKVSLMSEVELTELFTHIKNFKLTVTNHRGFKEAVITAGGVSTSEIEPLTMESKLIKNLYFAGEVIDMDADTGGYNLQLAFSTAYSAAMSI